MSGSTSARRDRERRRRRTGRERVRCGPGLRSGRHRRSESARSGTVPTIPPCRIAASCGAIRGRTVPVRAFIADVRADLADAKVRGAYADSYRAAELRDCLPWALTVVRSGMGPDGSAAVRAFQRVVLTGSLALRSNLSLASAIKESTLRRDGNGNPAIDSARSRGRIDVLSAAVLAVGAGSKPRPSRGGIVRSAICEAVG